MHVLVNAMGSGWVGDYAPAPPPNANLAARQRKTSEQNRGVGAWPGFSIQDPSSSSLEVLEINHLYSLFIQVGHLLLTKPGASLEEPLCWRLNFQFRSDIQPDPLMGTAQQFLAFACDPTQKRYNQFQFRVPRNNVANLGVEVGFFGMLQMIGNKSWTFFPLNIVLYVDPQVLILCRKSWILEFGWTL